MSLLASAFRSTDVTLALSVAKSADKSFSKGGNGKQRAKGKKGERDRAMMAPLSAKELEFVMTPHDLKRLDAYARSMVDWHLVGDRIIFVSFSLFLFFHSTSCDLDGVSPLSELFSELVYLSRPLKGTVPHIFPTPSLSRLPHVPDSLIFPTYLFIFTLSLSLAFSLSLSLSSSLAFAVSFSLSLHLSINSRSRISFLGSLHCTWKTVSSSPNPTMEEAERKVSCVSPCSNRPCW